jgi:hypothetical protein
MRRFGRKRAISGKRKRSRAAAIKLNRKGRTPLQITPNGTPVMFLTTKTQMASGGMITPIMMPNQMGS